MLVVVDGTAINPAAIAAITTEYDDEKLKVKRLNPPRDDVEVSFSILPVIELVTGAKIPMYSRTLREQMQISHSELNANNNDRNKMRLIRDMVEDNLMQYRNKAAENVAQYINQLVETKDAQ